jgi:hypothetical protein
MEPRHPACEWVEVAEDEEQTIICGKPAAGFVTDSTGRHHYGCAEHASAVKAHVGSGNWQLIPGHASARPYPESIP